MTLAGWIMMSVIVGSMTALFVWCTWKVMQTTQSEAYVELDTPDMHQID